MNMNTTISNIIGNYFSLSDTTNCLTLAYDGRTLFVGEVQLTYVKLFMSIGKLVPNRGYITKCIVTKIHITLHSSIWFVVSNASSMNTNQMPISKRFNDDRWKASVTFHGMRMNNENATQMF